MKMENSKKEKPYGKQVTNFDEAFTQLGCGSVQIKQHILFFLMCVPFAYQSLFMVFAVKEPEWKCVANSSSCMLEGSFGPDSDYYHHRCSVPRSEWEYVKVKEWSLVMEFDLVCDKAVLVNVSGSAFFLGAVFGALVFGWAADRFGRKKVLWTSLILAQVAASIAPLAPSIWVFTALRLIIGFYYYGVALAMTILSCEIVGPTYRAMSSVSLWIYFSLGLILLGVQAYFIRNWQHLGLVCSLPYFLVFLFYKFIPESIRWLWVTGQEGKSQDIVNQIARAHCKPPISLEGLKSTRKEKPLPSFSKLFNSQKLLIQTLIQGYLWFVQGLLYYGFFLVSENLSGHLYKDFIMTSFMDIPANIFSIYCARRFKRKHSFLASVIIASLSSGGIAALASSETTVVTYVRLVLGLVGKFFVSNASNLLYVWSPEIYPTVVRSKAMGIFSALRPLGGAVAPWVTTLLIVYHSALPFAVLASLSAVQIFLCFALPETKGKPLKDNFQEKGIDNQSFKKGEMIIGLEDLKPIDLLPNDIWGKTNVLLNFNLDKETEAQLSAYQSAHTEENYGYEADDHVFIEIIEGKDEGDRSSLAVDEETISNHGDAEKRKVEFGGEHGSRCDTSTDDLTLSSNADQDSIDDEDDTSKSCAITVIENDYTERKHDAA